jgi:TRAP-type C4-dicarboxylate transport system substrate-binding protein
MKKRVLFGVLAVTLVFLFLGAWATVAPAASPQKIDIGFVHIWPASHMTQAEQFPRFFKKVEAATKGKYILNIKYYPAGTLVGGAEIYDSVVKGIVDAGSSVPSYTPGRFPVMLTLSQAGIAPPTSSDSAARIVWEFYKKYKPKEVEDLKVLYWYATGPAWLHSRTPVRKLEDIKGADIRATGASAVALKALGANPVAMPQPEVYISAQKGIVKGSVAPLEVLQGYKQAEVFDCSTFVPFLYSEQFYTIMNWAKWKALPKDLQAAFDAVAEDGMKEGGQIWQHIQALGMEYAKKKPKGHEFIYLSKEEEARWIALLGGIKGKYIAELNGKGLPGEEIVKEAGKLAEKYNAQKYEPWKP